MQDKTNDANPMALPVFSVDDMATAEKLLKRIGHKAKDGQYYITLPEFNHEPTDLWETNEAIRRAFEAMQKERSQGNDGTDANREPE